MERKKTGKPKLNAGTFHKKLTDMKKKIKQTNQDANGLEQGIYFTIGTPSYYSQTNIEIVQRFKGSFVGISQGITVKQNWRGYPG